MSRTEAAKGKAFNKSTCDVSARKHNKTEDPLFGWTATDRPLDILPDNLDLTSSTGHR